MKTIEEIRAITPEQITIQYVNFWGPWRNEKHGTGNDGGMLIGWSCEGMGWGSLTVLRAQDGKLAMDDECMDDEFDRKVFTAFVSAVLAGAPMQTLAEAFKDDECDADGACDREELPGRRRT